MRLLIVNARFLTQNITGVQKFAIEISKQVKKKLKKVIFVSPRNIIHKSLAEYLDVKIVGRFSGHLWEQLELPYYLRNLTSKPILLNLANTAPLGYKDKVVTVHDLAFIHNPKWFSKKFYYYYKFLIPKILTQSIQIFTVSNFSKSELVKIYKISPDKITVVYNAISHDFLEKKGNLLRNNFNKYILGVSSLEPRKNIKTLINSFEELAEPNLSLVLVGKENPEVFSDNNFERYKSYKEKIHFTGYVSDEELVRLYSHAELFVYPSLYEGFGLPPLEAMASGCPVLVSNTTSMPEICGDAALYFDPNNGKELSSLILNVLNVNELRKTLIEKGADRVKKFSWSASADAIINSIKKIN
ncbi:glycosyltransferase family 1 protein [soil metagenome]